MDQGPDPGFDLAPASFDGMQLISSLKSACDVIEAHVAGHRNLVLLACDPESPIGVRPRRGSKYEKILQLAALLMLASGSEHHLAQFLSAPSFLGHRHLSLQQ